MRVESASGDRLKSRLNVTSGLEGGGGGRELRTTVAVFEEVKNRVDRNYKTFPGKMNENICSYCGDRYYTLLDILFARALDSPPSPCLLLHSVIMTMFSPPPPPLLLSAPKPNWCLFGKIDIYFPYPFGNTNTSYWIFISRGYTCYTVNQSDTRLVPVVDGGALVWRWWRRCYRRKGVFPTRRRSRQAVPYG